MKTIAIFRKIKNEIIAIFPCIPGTNDANTCLSYAHIGQHGAISVFLSGHLATPHEYAPLKRELEQIGYQVDVKNRSCPAYCRRREIALKELNDW